MTWEIVATVVGASALWKFIEFLVSRGDKKKEKQDETAKALNDLNNAIKKIQDSIDDNNVDMSLQNEALMALSQDRILFLAREFIKQGWIYDDDLKNLRRMANAYRALGGNDLVSIEMDMVDKLPVKVRGA